MARPKRTMAAATQAGTALTRTTEVKEAGEVKRVAEPVVKEKVKETAAAVKEVAEPGIEKSVVVGFGGRQVVARDVLAQAEKEYATTHLGTVIKSIELYMSPEQSAAYYVINGEDSDDFRIQL